MIVTLHGLNNKIIKGMSISVHSVGNYFHTNTQSCVSVADGVVVKMQTL